MTNASGYAHTPYQMFRLRTARFVQQTFWIENLYIFVIFTNISTHFAKRYEIGIPEKRKYFLPSIAIFVKTVQKCRKLTFPHF